LQGFLREIKIWRKRFFFEFDNYRANEVSKTAVRERMLKAYQLATGNRPIPTAFDSFGGLGGNRGAGHEPVQQVKCSNAKKIGNALGISDEQRKDAE